MTQFERRNAKASKLTPSQVVEIRRRYAEGATQNALCREYQMSIGQIGRIVRGESWHSLEGGAIASPAMAKASEAAFLAKLAADAELRNANAQHVPASPLDDEDEKVPAEEPTRAQQLLQERAKALGLDIEQLRSKP